MKMSKIKIEKKGSELPNEKVKNLNKYTMTKITIFAITIATVLIASVKNNANAQITPGSPDNFITVWNTGNETYIKIPGIGSGYNYNLYWEKLSNSTTNGTATVTTSSTMITDLEANTDYKVEIKGTFPRININNDNDLRLNIKEIKQWGTNQWSSFEDAFYGAENLIYSATDNPNLTNVTNMQNMFQNATNFNGDLNGWNTQNVTNTCFKTLQTLTET